MLPVFTALYKLKPAKFTWPPKRRVQTLTKMSLAAWVACTKQKTCIYSSRQPVSACTVERSAKDGSLGSVHHKRKRDSLNSVHLSLMILGDRLYAWAVD